MAPAPDPDSNDWVQTLECDYLVLGASPTTLAFVDSLLLQLKTRGKQNRIAIVDENDNPGGYWNDIHRFARLDMDSAQYGVSSRPLETYLKAKGGQVPSSASPSEILDYYSDVMGDFLSTGHVQYLPMCSFRDEQVVSLTEQGRVWRVPATCKIVESAIPDSQVPSARPPPFKVVQGARIVPPNKLQHSLATPPPAKYCIIGAGSTAVEVVLWLLSRGVQPRRVQWVMPRDQWLLPRGMFNLPRALAMHNAFQKAAEQAESVRGLLEELEKCGLGCRLDPSQQPECFHGANVSSQDLEQLRQVTDIVRLGHVEAVREDRLLLERGTVPLSGDTLLIDCTSTWIRTAKEPVPIFEGRRITLQMVQEISIGGGIFNTTASAGLLGAIEGRELQTTVKMSLCTPMRYPDTSRCWLRAQVDLLKNRKFWSHPFILSWVSGDRLGPFSALNKEALKQMWKAGPYEGTVQLEKILSKEDEAARRAASRKSTASGR